MGQQTPVDPLSDQTVKSFFDACNAEVALSKSCKLALGAMLAAVLAGDTATANSLFLKLSQVSSTNTKPFYVGLAAQITAAQAAVATGLDPTNAILNLTSSVNLEILSLTDKRSQLQIVRDKTTSLVPDPAGVAAALSKISADATGDSKTFYKTLSTTQTQAAAAVAALVTAPAGQAIPG